MGELVFTMWIELSSPPLPLADLKWVSLILAVLWASFQYIILQRLLQEPLIGAELPEMLCDREPHPGLSQVLPNPHSQKERTTIHVAPRPPY